MAIDRTTNGEKAELDERSHVRTGHVDARAKQDDGTPHAMGRESNEVSEVLLLPNPCLAVFLLPWNVSGEAWPV